MLVKMTIYGLTNKCEFWCTLYLIQLKSKCLSVDQGRVIPYVMFQVIVKRLTCLIALFSRFFVHHLPNLIGDFFVNPPVSFQYFPSSCFIVLRNSQKLGLEDELWGWCWARKINNELPTHASYFNFYPCPHAWIYKLSGKNCEGTWYFRLMLLY